MKTLTKDPKTVEAMNKIQAILAEYDLMGMLTVMSTERIHWLWHFDASWSCIHLNPDTGALTVRAKAADFKTDEQHEKVILQTINAMSGAEDLGVQQAVIAKQILAVFEQRMEFETVTTDVETTQQP